MPALLFLSPASLSGKTAVIAGLARRLAQSGTAFSLSRLEGDEHAAADAALFAGLAGQSPDAQVSLVEAPAGEAPPKLEDARAVVVVSAGVPAPDAAAFAGGLVPRPAGVVVNRVPARRLEELRLAYAEAGLEPLVLLPEDRLLAAPVLREVAEALSAKAEFLDGNALRPLDRPLIASIAADPGQGYFSRYGRTAVIVRSDKPDLQLAALNAGVDCLIVTGGLPILSYVMDRVEEDEVPLLRTELGTVAAVERIEALFAARPFAGGDAKLGRAAELLAGLDLKRLIA